MLSIGRPKATEEPIPASKISTTIRGTVVSVQTGQPSGGQDGDIWIQDSTNGPPAIYEHNGSSWVLDYTFQGGRAHVTTGAVDLDAEGAAANAGDLLLSVDVDAGVVTIYRRRAPSLSPPYWTLIGATGAAAVAAWARSGDVSLIPTAKVNLAGIQSQIDTIVDELTHATGPVTEVLGVLGSGSDSLRYTLGAATAGSFDISVTVKARVQLNDLVNFSGTLQITEDGGGGLNTIILPRTHNHSDHHEATLTFVRRGVEVPLGSKDILFTAGVTGGNPPDVHFIELETLKLTPTALVNSANVGEFVQDFAEEGNADVVPYAKLRKGGTNPAGGSGLGA